LILSNLIIKANINLTLRHRMTMQFEASWKNVATIWPTGFSRSKQHYEYIPIGSAHAVPVRCDLL